MRRSVGIIIILLGVFYCWYYGSTIFDQLYYDHRIFCFAPSIPVSITNSILAIFGIYVGIKMIKNKIRLGLAIIIVIITILIGFLIDPFGYLIF